MFIEHKKLAIRAELKDFSQDQFETYHTKLLEHTKGNNSVAVANGAVVRAAIDAGFLSGVLISAIGGMSPAAVIWLTKKIHAHVVSVTTPPLDEEKTETKN